MSNPLLHRLFPERSRARLRELAEVPITEIQLERFGGAAGVRVWCLLGGRPALWVCDRAAGWRLYAAAYGYNGRADADLIPEAILDAVCGSP